MREELNPDTILDVNPLAQDIIQAAVLQDIRYSLKKDLEENDAVINKFAYYFQMAGYLEACLQRTFYKGID